MKKNTINIDEERRKLLNDHERLHRQYLELCRLKPQHKASYERQWCEVDAKIDAQLAELSH